MKDLHDTIYDILTEFQDTKIPKLEVLDQIMTEIKKDVDLVTFGHIEANTFLGNLSKELLDQCIRHEKEISKLTRKLLKV